MVDFTDSQRKSNHLVEAARSGLFPIVRDLLDKGADINSVLLDSPEQETYLSGTTALYHAVYRRDLAMVDELISRGANINRSVGNTVLQAAVASEDQKMLRACIDLGASIYDEIAVWMAVRMDEPLILETLVVAVTGKMTTDNQRGRSKREIRDTCKFALLEAVRKQNMALVQAPVKAETGIGRSIKERSWFRRTTRPEKSLFLLPGVLYRNSFDTLPFGTHPLAVAIERENIDLVKFFVQQGAEVKVASYVWTNGILRTPIQQAVAKGKEELVEYLLAHSADVNSPAGTYVGRTPLQQAVDGGNLPLVRLLLRHGADPNGVAGRISGATALQLAAMHGYLGIAHVLLTYGADPNAARAQYCGRTALEAAAEWGRIDMVQFLLNHGAYLVCPEDPEHCYRAFRRAYKNGHHALIGVLETHLAIWNSISAAPVEHPGDDMKLDPPPDRGPSKPLESSDDDSDFGEM